MMSNWQLLISAGMPTLAVLIGILVNQSQLNGLSCRIDRLSTRVDQLAERVSGLAERIAALEVRVAHLEEQAFGH